MERNRSPLHLQFGAVTLVPGERLLLRDGRPVALTPKAFDLLVVLATNPGRLLTKEQLLDAVWPDTTVEESNLSYHVFAIRKALGEQGDADRYIETVPKQGYRFVAPVVRVEAGGQQLPEMLTPITDTPQDHGASERQTAASVGTERGAQTLLTRRAGRVWWPWLGLGAVLTLGAVWYFGLDRPPRASAPSALIQYQDPVTGRLAETGMFSVSPDGRYLVFAAEGADGVLRLWARTMSALEPVPLPGTEVPIIIPPAAASFICASHGKSLRSLASTRGSWAGPRLCAKIA